MRAPWFALVLVAGCAVTPRPAPLANRVDVAAEVPAATYSGLFAADAVYHYRAVVDRFPWDGGAPTRTTARVACQVTRVARSEAAMVAVWSCTPDRVLPASSLAVGLGGAYIAVPSGLWWRPSAPRRADVAALVARADAGDDEDFHPERWVLDAATAPRHRRQFDDAGVLLDSRVARNADGAWCATQAASTGDDDRATTLCFRDGVLTRVTTAFGGEAAYQAVVTLLD